MPAFSKGSFQEAATQSFHLHLIGQTSVTLSHGVASTNPMDEGEYGYYMGIWDGGKEEGKLLC